VRATEVFPMTNLGKMDWLVEGVDLVGPDEA